MFPVFDFDAFKSDFRLKLLERGGEGGYGNVWELCDMRCALVAACLRAIGMQISPLLVALDISVG